MKSDEVFDFHHYVRLRDEESVKARLSKVSKIHRANTICI